MLNKGVESTRRLHSNIFDERVGPRVIAVDDASQLPGRSGSFSISFGARELSARVV
jgi:hypothetical protein